METQSKTPKSYGFDSETSMFHWEMILDTNHPRNKTDFMRGYSKKYFHTETTNRTQLLLTKIKMLIREGYFERSNQIDIYQRNGAIINFENRTLVFTMTNKPVPGSNPQKRIKDFCFAAGFLQKSKEINIINIIQWLNPVFADLRTGTPILPKVLMAETKKNFAVSIDDRINPKKYYPKSLSDIMSYCNKLLHDGFKNNQVAHFYRTILDANPNLQ